MQESIGRKNLRIRLNWLSRFRLAISISLLCAVLLFRPGKEGAHNSLAFYVALAVACTHFLAACVFFWKRYTRVVSVEIAAYAHILWDVIFASSMVYVSCAADAKFILLYLLTIFNAAFLLFSTGAYVASALSTFFYAIVIYALYLDSLPSMFVTSLLSRGWTDKDVIASILSKGFIFLLTAGFSSLIAKTFRKNEEALEESKSELRVLEQQMKSLWMNIEDGLMMIDDSGKVYDCNQAAIDILSLDPNQKQDRNLFHLYPRLAHTFLQESMIELLADTPLGQKTLAFTLVRFKNDSETQQSKLVLVRDLTEMRSMEQKMKKNQQLAMVGEMAARMAHEIRNPLTSVSAALEMLQKEQPNSDDSKQMMSIVSNETERLNQLLTDFLQFAKPKPKDLHFVELSKIVEETIFLFEKSLSQEVLIESHIDAGIQFYGDSKRLKQMLWNFLTNAIDAMDSKGQLKLQLHLDKLGKIVLSIEDTGKGIPQELLPKIFDPFFSTKPRGTGLGLSVIHQIIEEHDGQVFVDTSPNGTRFTVTFFQKGSDV